MSRRALTWAVFVVGVVSVVGAFLYLTREPEVVTTDPVELEAQEAEGRRQREERWDAIREESRDLIPDALDGVELGMSLTRAQQRRPRMHRNPATSANPETPGLRFMEEDLPGGARAVYGFEVESQRLQRLQVLSLLPDASAIGPHLAAMNETYGTPTGIWSCPNTGGVPTRRFTWRHGRNTVSDVFLVYGGRVSVTLYIAPSTVIFSSLRRAQCTPVTSREDAVEFPVTTEEQMMNTTTTP